MAVEASKKQQVAYELLIELLVHQFAFPVKWVDTQETLLFGKKAVERYVEFGPSSVLTGMAQKTVKRSIRAGAETTFLTSTQNKKELFYEYDTPVQSVEEGESLLQTKSSASSPATPPKVAVPISSLASGADASVASTVAAMADVPLSGEQVARALVARKLKLPISKVPGTKSIKELTNGKSTLQNELVGDFQSEFGNLPDRSEELSLKDLGEVVASGADISLGKMSSALLAKLISSKMPARFNSDAIGQYLASQWGLGPMRRMAVMLFAIAAEPDARLTSVGAAEQYLDEVCGMYADWCGIDLQARPAAMTTPEGTSTAVDPAVMAEVSQMNTTLAKKQFKALAEYLQVDVTQSDDTQGLIEELQRKVDSWTSEFSQDFLEGIKPRFDPQKNRRYDAWWNCARQDILAMFSGDSPCLDDGSIDDVPTLLSNRADNSLLQMFQGLAHGEEGSSTREKIATAIKAGINHPPKAVAASQNTAPKTDVTEDGHVEYTEVKRFGLDGSKTYVDLLQSPSLSGEPGPASFVTFSSPGRGSQLTSDMLAHMRTALRDGMSFEGKRILVTGASMASIGFEVIKLLVMGGAQVIATTSREPSSVARHFQKLYESCGAKGSQLVLTQFNQASAQDCEKLIDHIYSADGLGMDLDAVLPFAAAPEGGIEMQDVAAQNEMVHRLMLANVFRLLGRIIKNKRDRGIDCHPTQVLLPLSPNHGIFGGDGMYAESKLGLESLLNRVESESWSNELSICGVKIGWTRGTGLMNANDVVAQSIEEHGVLTFSAKEMAFNIAVLMTPELVDLCETAPVMADFGGGLEALEDCATVLAASRASINEAAEIARAIKTEDEFEKAACTLPSKGIATYTSSKKSKSTLRVGFPRLPKRSDLSALDHLHGVNDPSDTIVVVGFSELGPHGSARLRWQMEHRGAFDQEGYLEMAWMMDLIKHFDGPYKDGFYVGWVDSKSGEPVADCDIEHRYGEIIREHSGIRFVDSQSRGGYDTAKKEYLHEVAIEEDLPEFEAPLATGEAFKLRHGDNVTVSRMSGTDTCKVQVKRGASIKIPKSVPFTWGSVAGQLPRGWNPSKYGIPDDMANQLDPVSLYTVCTVSEAFFSAGICNPQEIFKYLHLAEVGNFLGSSMGGALKTRQLYRDIYLDNEIQPDVLQETYLNTTAAWVNMLLLGSTGPIKTPMGACATAVESLDSACESIMAGKTKFGIVGGFDDFHEDESFGFSKMKATVDVARELAKGRLPREMSRPTAESRSGFVEAHGCGVQLVCRGDMALEMGLPVYAIIAGSTMAADKIGRSVPAPGQGVLTFARETDQVQMRPYSSTSDDCHTPSYANSCDSSTVAISCPETPSPFSSPPVEKVIQRRQFASAGVRNRDPTISPLREALETWGLTIDDLDVASLHGTSTKANDLNEPDVICQQMDHLGRSPHRPLWAICQKSVTGHPKAPAAAWMLNGCLQVLDTATIPGNRNADNVDPSLRNSRHLCFPTRTIQTRQVKAFLLTSFGFGQKGGQVVGVAPRYFFAGLGAAIYEDYRVRVTRRTRIADRKYAKVLMSGKIVELREKPPYEAHDQSRIFLDPLARISSEHNQDLYSFDTEDIRNSAEVRSRLSSLAESSRTSFSTQAGGDIVKAAQSAQRWLEKQVTARHVSGRASTVGLDVVDLDSFSSHDNEVFVERNFTADERDFARQSLDSKAAFASRWAAKEAVFKCLHTTGKGAGAAMKEIEIVKGHSAPGVKLHGDAMQAGRKAGLKEIQLSISHGDDCLVAVAVGISGSGASRYLS